MYFVYILTNWSNTVIYIGITNNLERRLYEHKSKLAKGFTERYNATKLVYFDCCPDVIAAIAREKQIKGWTRQKKINLVSEMNPQWRDLSEDWTTL